MNPLPAVAGALAVVPLFLLTRRLFGRAEAVVAAVLTAVLTGQLLQRSLAGNADHRGVEALLTTIVLLLLARAVDRDSVAEAALAGAALGLCLLTPSCGAFLVFVLTAWAVLEAATSPARLSRLVAPAFLVALAIAAPAAWHQSPIALTLPSLVGGIALLGLVEAARDRRSVRAVVTIVVPAAAAALAIALVGVPALRAPIARFVPSGEAAWLEGVQPLLVPDGRFTRLALWSELITASALAAIGLVIAARACRRERSASRELLLVWSTAVMAASLAQMRVTPGLAIAVAICASAPTVRVLRLGLARR